MKKNFIVKGMTCHACEMLIQDALEEAGVESVKAFHKDGFVSVEFDNSKVHEDRIKSLIKEEGFEVE